MLFSVRFLTWILCFTSSVFLSSRPFVREKLLFFVQSYDIPPWLYLLPLSFVAAWIGAQIIFFFLNLVRVSPKGKAVFITGCDTGFGFHLALKLRYAGYHVFAGCLFPEGAGATKLVTKSREFEAQEDIDEDSSDDFEPTSRPGMHIVQCDVTCDESLSRALAEVQRSLRDRVLWAVVANAGVGYFGFTEWISMERLQVLFDVNTFGVYRTFRYFVPLLRKSKGRFLVTTSWAARFAPPCIVPYAMTKHSVKAMCEGLRAELAPFGIKVCSIEPNMYRTSIVPATTKCLDNQWTTLTDEQRESYGKTMLKRARVMTQDFAYLCQENLQSPLWCFEHAISGMFPKASYECDRYSMLFLSKLVEILPIEFKSFFNHYIHIVLAFGRNLLPGRFPCN